MANYEIRIGALDTENRTMQRFRIIGIEPPLPEGLVDRIHSNPRLYRLPYLRFSTECPNDGASKPYSEATLAINPKLSDSEADRKAIEVAQKIAGLIHLTKVEINKLPQLKSTMLDASKKSWLFDEQPTANNIENLAQVA